MKLCLVHTYPSIKQINKQINLQRLLWKLGTFSIYLLKNVPKSRRNILNEIMAAEGEKAIV